MTPKIEQAEVESWLKDYAGFRPEKWDRIKEWLASHAPSAPQWLQDAKDERIITWLVNDKKFSPKAARKCLATFKETMAFAGIGLASEAAAQPTPAYLSSDENTTVIPSARVGYSPKGDRQAEIEHDH